MTANAQQRTRRRLYAIIMMVCVGAGVAILLVAVSAGAAPAGEPLVNESVTVEDAQNESIFVDVEFAEQSSVNVTVENSTGTEIASKEIVGVGGSTESAEFNVSTNQTFEVSVWDSETEISQVWISTAHDGNSSGLLAGSGSGSSGGVLSSSLQWVLLIVAALVGTAGLGAVLVMDS